MGQVTEGHNGTQEGGTERILLRNQHEAFFEPTAEEVGHLFLWSLPDRFFFFLACVGFSLFPFSLPSLAPPSAVS